MNGKTKHLMPNAIKNLILVPLIVVSIMSCNKDDADRSSEVPASSIDNLTGNCILIPIGQLTKTGSSVDIYIDETPITYEMLDDRLGGFWAVIPNSSFTQSSSTLNITITKRKTNLHLIERTNDSTDAYLKSSTYINWDTTVISGTAKSLTHSIASNTENALAIQNYVINYLTFDDTFTNHYGRITAQQTFEEKRGVCINYSRLFIALCRAAGIPARSVSGVVFPGGNVGEDCLGHHEWCEFLDENDQWRSLDLTFTHDVNINTVKYIGFTYCAEETELFAEYMDEFSADLFVPFKTKKDCLVPYCYLPTQPYARFGFNLLVNAMPDSIVFEKKFIVSKSGSTINIE